MDADGATDLRRQMEARRLACDHQISRGRQRAAAAVSAFTAALLSARSHAKDTVSHREKLNGLKDQLRRLEASLAEALSIQVNKGTKYKLTTESVLNATTTNEQLRSLVMDQRARRDEYANIISNQLEAIEALEANFDETGKKNLDEAIMWYNEFLGFQVVGGEGVKFVFNKIDMGSPDNEYLFCIKVNKDKYSLIQCVPLLKESEELVKDLNCTNDLFKFVRIMRGKFQAAATEGVCRARSLITSSPPALSVNTTSQSSTNQSQSRSWAKRGAAPRSAASPLRTLSSMRRSPRFAAVDAGNRH